MRIVSQTMCVTPEMAMEWLTTTSFPNQRGINKAKTAEYITVMKAGDWVPGSTIAFGVVDGTPVKYLLNGQHRLTALFEVGANIEFNLKEYQFTESENWMEQMKAIYAVEDTGLKRTVGNMLTAYDMHVQLDVPSAFLTRMSAGVRIISSGFNVAAKPSDISPQSIVAVLTEWAVEIKAAHGFLPQGRRKREDRAFSAPVLAVLLYTMRHCPGMAHAWWKSIADNDSLKKGTPAHTLRAFIADNTVQKTDRNVFLRKVINAWNAFYEGRDLSMLTVRDPKCDIRIFGTPMR